MRLRALKHQPKFAGYYVKVVIVEVVIVKLGKHQITIKCLRIATASHTASHMLSYMSQTSGLGYNHPGYDHLNVALIWIFGRGGCSGRAVQ